MALGPREFRPKVGKSILFLIGTAAAVAACFWLSGRPDARPLDRLVGLAGMAFFGLGFLIVLRILLTRRAFLRLDDEGIRMTDHAGREVLRARWTDIVDVYEGTAGGMPVVVLVALDTQAGLSEGATAPRGIDDAGGHQTDPGYIVNPGAFDLAPEDLIAWIRPYWEASLTY